MNKSLLLLGCGKMGGALLQGWLEKGYAAHGICVIEHSEAATAQFEGIDGVTLVRDIPDVPADFRPGMIMLALKPQMMDAAAPLARYAGPETAFLSIAAGKTIRYFENLLGSEAAIIRSMPNTPAAVGRGITAYVGNEAASQTQMDLAGDLLSAVGEALEVPEEGMLDAVTAVSGSGPAYVFLVIEAMAAAGEKLGLSADLAMRLASATVSGAGELARQSSEPAAQLRQNVTSPGGTTAEALKVLMADDGIGPVFEKALKAAADRSRELAG
ncbi:pyrroline-5-carboxylate reductase [Nisaea sp.]|uniref:pyrroline-5-carboxylate reductase n=1 Tax=Nisaea sp. TaxID=2024842 RepID=UPI003297CD9A